MMVGVGAGSPPTIHVTKVASSDDEGDVVGVSRASAAHLNAIPELQELESKHKAMSNSNVADPEYEKKSTKVYEYLVEQMEKADVNSEGKLQHTPNTKHNMTYNILHTPYTIPYRQLA